MNMKYGEIEFVSTLSLDNRVKCQCYSTRRNELLAYRR